MIKEHYDAVRALLPPDSDTFHVYLGKVDATPVYPYVVLWGAPGTMDSETLADIPTDFSARIKATSAGTSFGSVAITMDRVRTALNRARPIVTGRKVEKLILAPLMDIQTDFNVSIAGAGHPLYGVDEYLIQSTPA